jgi:hypothetical protein
VGQSSLHDLKVPSSNLAGNFYTFIKLFLLILLNLALILQPILHFLLCSENRRKYRIVPKCCFFQCGNFVFTVKVCGMVSTCS